MRTPNTLREAIENGVKEFMSTDHQLDNTKPIESFIEKHVNDYLSNKIGALRLHTNDMIAKFAEILCKNLGLIKKE